MDAFCIKLLDVRGNPMAVGGLTVDGYGEACARTMCHAQGPCFDGCRPQEVDLMLAEWLTSCAEPELLAAGASIRLPEYERGVTCGGVIGSPNQQPRSASGELERLDCGLWLYSRPEGPGAAFLCDARTAKTVAAEIGRCRELGSISPRGLAEIFVRRDISCFLAVYDGCGLGARGCVFVSGKEMIYLA